MPISISDLALVSLFSRSYLSTPYMVLESGASPWCQDSFLLPQADDLNQMPTEAINLTESPRKFL